MFLVELEKMSSAVSKDAILRMLKKAGYQDQVRKLWSLKTNKNFLYDYFWFPKPKKTEHV